MISYARNAEDVVLARALNGLAAGFYVDVGAQSPTSYSRTRHFYDHGWHGVNIVPLPEWAAQFRSERGRDLNLELAVGASPGTSVLYRVVDDPSRSTLSVEIASKYVRAGLRVEELRIPITTMTQVLEEADAAVIDFLAVDLDGVEVEVFQGLDLERWRPRVIVVANAVAAGVGCEPMLLDARYVFAASDGVNRFYARHEEAAALVPRLAPANSTDMYKTLREYLLEDEVSQLRVTVRSLELDLARATAELTPDATAVVRGPSPSDAAVPPFGRVIDLERIAICTSPETGPQLLAPELAARLTGVEVVSYHPADVAWDELPERCVLTLYWSRTERLHALLSSNGFRVVTIVRHPLDTALSLLRLAQTDDDTRRFLDGSGGRDDDLSGRDPNATAFVDWLTGARGQTLLNVSALWKADPAVIRINYDDLVHKRADEVTQLLQLGGYPSSGLDQPSETPANDCELLGNAWQQFLTAETLDRLGSSIGPIASRLGFSADFVQGGTLPDPTQASANWRQLLNQRGSNSLADTP